MSKFLRLIFLFCFILTAILSSLGFIVDKGLQKSRAGNYSEWNDIRNGNINANLIIGGSSRAWVHISPYILDTALHLNSYNLGLDGHHFDIQYTRYKYYEKFNEKPEYILHSLDLFMLTKREDLYMVEQFSPYLNDPVIAYGTKDYIGFSWVDYLNPFTKYQYNSRYIAIGLLEFFNIKHFKSRKHKGYEGKDQKWDQSFEIAKQKKRDGWTVVLDKELISLFDSFLDDCKKKEIKVVLVYSPEYIEAQNLTKNRNAIISVYQELAKKHGVPFLNYSNNELCHEKDYFYNSQHMNRKGAELFSVKLASDLKNIFHTATTL